MNWFDFLIEIEGIIGALMGVTLTLIITHILNNAGKIDIEIIDANLSFFTTNSWGEQEGTSLESAENMAIKFSVNLYNDSMNPKPMKNIRLAIYDENSNKIEYVNIQDSSTDRLSAGAFRFDDIHYINVMPKQVLRKDLRYGTSLTGNPELRKSNSFILFYENGKGRTKKKKII